MNTEIELKVVNIKDIRGFQAKLSKEGATETKPWRLISDQSFAAIRSLTEPISDQREAPNEFWAVPKFVEMLAFCGYQSIELADGLLKLHRPLAMPRVSVRLRRDGEQQFFTVKDRRQKNVVIDRRREIELEITELEWLKSLFLEVGMFHKSSNEKLRRSFDLDGAHIDLQVGPYGLPFAEIEAASETAVYQTVERLGFTTDQTSTWSDRQYFINCGGLDPLNSRWVSFPRTVDIDGILQKHQA